MLPLPCRLVVSLCCIVISSAHAQSLWSGTTGNWSTVGNWLPGSLPISSNTTALIFGGGSGYTATNDLGNFTLNQIQFENTAGTITINGAPTTNALELVNSTSAALPSIQISAAGNATISTPVTWTGNSTVINTGAGTLRFASSQTYANGSKQTFLNNGTGKIVLADAITYANAGTGTGVVLNFINNNPTASTFDVGNLGGLGNVTLNIGGTGTVRFAGSTGGDLMSGSAMIHVQSGATFDFNGNGESFGAFSGAGTMRSTVAVSPSAAGYYEFSGKFTGTAGSLTVGGASHTLVLSGATSDYTGATTITAGRVHISANAPNGSAGALGNATSDVLLGNTSGANNAALVIDTPDITIGRNIRAQSGNTGVAMIGGLNNSGTATYSGNVIMGTNSAAATGITVTAVSGGMVDITGNLLRATAATGTTDTLTVTGNGTVALYGSNTFTGATTVNGGMLVLDYGTHNDSKLSSTAGLTLSGGSITVLGHSGESTTQSVTGLSLGNSAAPLGGGARIVVTSGLHQNSTLSLGPITRNAGATASFFAFNTGTGVASITTTTPNTVANILGGYATFNRNDWAVNDGAGNITALSAGSYGTVFATGLHTSISASAALPSGGATTHTLRIVNTAALTFNSTTPGTLTLESGGLLIASTAGATSIGTTGTRGAFSSTTGEVIVHQQSTAGTLTINSNISGTHLVKSGDGALTLTGTNTYTGSTIINGGTVSVTASAHLGAATADVTINGGTLALPSGTLGTLSAANRVITVGPSGATFHFTANQAFEGSGLAGSGNLKLTGTGILTFGSSASTYNGHLAIGAGTVKMNSQQLNSVASITVANGATYHVEDDTSATFSLASGGRFVINGNGVGGNGAIRVSDQTPGTSQVDPRTTLDREIALQSTSRIQVDNGTAAGSLSQLSLTGNVTGTGGLVKTGNGVLVLSARDNTYTGGTTIAAGTLRLNLGNDRLPTYTTVTLGAGTTSGNLQLNGYTQTISGLTTAGTGTANAVTGGTSTANSLLALNVESGTQTYNGTLGATGVENTHVNNNLGFIKDGAGTVVLGSANTFNGAATVASGTLVLGNANALGNGGVSLATTSGGTTVSAGGTLDLNGQANVQEVITLNGNGLGNAGALVNNSATPASIGSGVASLTVSSVTTTGWSAGAGVAIGTGNSGDDAVAVAQLGLTTASLSITNGGSGFGLAPVVNVTGGSGAVVTAQVGVTSTSYTVPAFVVGTTTTYSVAPNVTLQNGATGVAVLNASGYVIGITVTSPGNGFFSTPTATFSGGTTSFAGTNPTAAGNNSNYTITNLAIKNAGTGFTASPTVTITGGTGAAVIGNDSNFALNGFAITSNGSGYTTVPAVHISGGSATATANLTTINLASASSLGGSGDLTVHAVISGGYGLTKVGMGTATLTGTNTYSGSTTVSAGTLQIGVSGNGSIAGNLSATSASFSTTTIVGVNAQNNPVSGQIFITGAPIVAGTGTIEGNVMIGTNISSVGVLQPGDTGGSSTGMLRIVGNLTVNNGSQIQLGLTSSASNDAGFDWSTTNAKTYIDGIYESGSGTTYTQHWQTATGSYDTLKVNGTLVLGSAGAGSNLPTLLVTSNAGTFSAGDIFKLIDWAMLGTFNSISGGGAFDVTRDLVLPDLNSSGLAWDTSAFSTYGVAVVVGVVPEPGRATLLIMAFAAMALRRRRQATA